MVEYLTKNYLDLGHHIYMDRYYTSPSIFEYLLANKTYACGTVMQNRLGLGNKIKEEIQ